MSTPEQRPPVPDASDDSPPPSAAPSVVRQLRSPASLALADLAALYEDLQTVLRCCERLVQELQPRPSGPDDLALEAYWTTAVLSYARCFAPGQRGTGLTEQDVTATGLPGDVLGWHRALLALRDRYADAAVNPRESFSVGASQDASGHAEGIAVASARQPPLDEVSVRQTGAVAFGLSKVVDEKLAAQQGVVFTAVAAMARPALDQLPLMHLVVGPEVASDPR
ncbi:MAG: hypothetical protein AVDCRST_MAG16-1846 [uncultured Frankineae bacterium]|uniref:Uncharacterized protein n=1 Tax=uncultured Frankineae bacterium TaxID=437475 RepID=A0A6J4LTL1_9ACTN|nr:MAG: hypothetical protein AVDCRST_MAG16-1846 [uncultured Frankineae bacterium]